MAAVNIVVVASLSFLPRNSALKTSYSRFTPSSLTYNGIGDGDSQFLRNVLSTNGTWRLVPKRP